MNRRKPDLIFIGPYKSGSLYLRGYFDAHPGIVWTRQAQFFLAEANAGRAADYPAEVPADAEGKYFIDMFESMAIGYVFREADNWDSIGFRPFKPITDSILVPDHRIVAGRVRAAAPDTKILLCIRNQIDWLRSSYLHHIHFLLPRDRSFGRFMNTLEGKCALDAGHYDRAIDAYEAALGPGRVHVMLLEDIMRDKEAALRRLCDFMGLAYAPYPDERESRNTGRGNLAGTATALLSRAGLSDRQIRRIGRLAKPALPLLRRVAERDVIGDEQKELLAAAYAASNFRTARLTGLDLAGAGYPV